MGRAGKGGGASGGGSGLGRGGFSSGGNRSFAGRSGSSSSNQSRNPFQNSQNNNRVGNNTQNSSSFPLGMLVGSLLGKSQRNTVQQPTAFPSSPHSQVQFEPSGQNSEQSNEKKRGCLFVVFAAIALLFIGFLFLQNTAGGGSGANNDVSLSTIKRVPLPLGSVTETGFYNDELAWINNPTTLVSGMKEFYEKTGVQPYLHITDNLEGSHHPTDAQAQAFATQLYDSLFTDEAHILIIFFEYQDRYHTWALAGTQAQTVLDKEAVDILLDYFDLYYFSDFSEEEMFAKTFSDAAKRIMEVTTSPWIPVFIVISILLILLVIFLWWSKRKAQKNLDAEQTKAILETPLETFKSSETAEIASKYSTMHEKPSGNPSSAEELAEKYNDQ